ncbi:hypothetical protein AGR5A_pa30019 [Agrobacterium genomosp. 5 str. CFBP 6626]|nr:hypothetical protein AGR5A_pa30019 [Agrobacterium genomosp. 5 str. CFBP 6626]
MDGIRVTFASGEVGRPARGDYYEFVFLFSQLTDGQCRRRRWQIDNHVYAALVKPLAGDV